MNWDNLQRDNWHGGQLLGFSGLDGTTDYQNALTARTAFGTPGIDVKLPASSRITFPHARATTPNVVAGDWFQLDDAQAPVVGALVDTYHLLLTGPCEVRDAETGIVFVQKDNRTLVGVASHFRPELLATDMAAVLCSRRRWLESLALPPGASDVRRRTLLKCLSVLKTQVYTPEGRIRHRWTTPDRWPHRRMWLWDSAFHAIGWRHVCPQSARDAISSVLDTQAADGFVAHMMDPTAGSRITQPPVLALAAKRVNDVAPDAAWLEALYPKLCGYVEWDLVNRDRDGDGLLEWEIEGNPLCRSGESGMDNSPRFDAATRMAAVDFSAFAALECEILAAFAATQSLPAEAAKWRERHAAICERIRTRLWSEDAQFFVDYDMEHQAPSPVLASSGFLPLLCGAASAEQAAQLATHLRNPQTFGTAFPVPSIAACDTAHYSKDMWRGPVWINVNWLIACGLERYGLHAAAATLRDQTMRTIEDACEKFGVPFEFYDDRGEVDPPRLLRKGRCAPETSPYHQSFHDYGWTASLYVDMVYAAATAR